MSRGKRFPQYLYRQYRIWIFERDEMLLLLSGLAGAIFFTLWCIPAGMAVSLWMRATRDRRSRGYLKHFLYRIGGVDYKGYPDHFTSIFHE